MNGTLFIPTANYTSCLILPQRNKSLSHLPCINPFISTVHPKESLGLVPIRKLFLTKKLKKMNITHSRNISLIESLAKNFKENEKKKKEEHGSIDYKILIQRYKQYKRKCDKKNKQIQIYRKELSFMPNDYKRTMKLNQLIDENEKSKRKEKSKAVIKDKDESKMNEEEKVKQVDDIEHKENDTDLNKDIDKDIDKGEDEKEMKEVIEYISQLDYDQYIRNKEIREALQLLKNKMDQESYTTPSSPLNNDILNIITNGKENINNKKEEEDIEGNNDNKEDEAEIEDNKEKSIQIEEPKPIINKEEEKKKEAIEQYHMVEKISKNVKKLNRVHSCRSIQNILNRDGLLQSNLIDKDKILELKDNPISLRQPILPKKNPNVLLKPLQLNNTNSS